MTGDGPRSVRRSYIRRGMAGRREERAWVRGAQAGSVSDLEALFRSHWAPAWRAAYLVVHDAAAAEDIAQEAFLAAIRNLERFDRRRPFRPRRHRIVLNRAIPRARAPTRWAELEFHDTAAAASTPDLGSDVAAAIQKLAPEHRAVIVLRYLLEYTPGEIATMLGLPRGTVNSRLRRGLDSLRETLP